MMWRRTVSAWPRLVPAGAAAVRRCRARVALALALAAVGLGSALAGPVPEAALERRVGHAFLLGSGDLVYREIHEPEVADGELVGDRVTYRAPDGRIIARKRVDFAPEPLVPAFRLEDRRTGYLEGLERSGDGEVTLFHRDGEGAEVERERIEAPDGLVADAGFDVLIYRRLDELKAGKTLAFPFAVPSRLDTITFRLRAVDRREILGQPAVVIRMEPNSAVLRWLVDPIDVAYHARTAALLRYEGVSNIPNPDADGNYRVRIDFPPDGVEPVPPAGDEEDAPERRGR